MIVLDTHVLIWWVNGDDQLSSRANPSIRNWQILVSAVSAWEIAMLVAKGRLALTMEVDDWLETVVCPCPHGFLSVTHLPRSCQNRSFIQKLTYHYNAKSDCRQGPNNYRSSR